MAESIFMRVRRVISASIEDAVDAMERAGGTSVMREAVREVDDLRDLLAALQLVEGREGEDRQGLVAEMGSAHGSSPVARVGSASPTRAPGRGFAPPRPGFISSQGHVAQRPR